LADIRVAILPIYEVIGSGNQTCASHYRTVAIYVTTRVAIQGNLNGYFVFLRGVTGAKKALRPAIVFANIEYRT
jgi:hypothetical protein